MLLIFRLPSCSQPRDSSLSARSCTHPGSPTSWQRERSKDYRCSALPADSEERVVLFVHCKLRSTSLLKCRDRYFRVRPRSDGNMAFRTWPLVRCKDSPMESWSWVGIWAPRTPYWDHRIWFQSIRKDFHPWERLSIPSLRISMAEVVESRLQALQEMSQMCGFLY